MVHTIVQNMEENELQANVGYTVWDPITEQQYTISE